MSQVEKFKITYEDPETSELVVVVKEFKGVDGPSASLQVRDFAYACADKGWFKIELVEENVNVE